MEQAKTAIIIGAGPAGLTAAYELLARTDIRPVVIERSAYMGGIARTINHHGNRIDIGGHRFFSKSDRVMQWWLDMMPLEKHADGDAIQITYQRKTRSVERSVEAQDAAPDPETTDLVMLVRQRKSRIYYLRQFFDYPISLRFDTLRKLGAWRTVKTVPSTEITSTLVPSVGLAPAASRADHCVSPNATRPSPPANVPTTMALAPIWRAIGSLS
ncbi:MAG: NAD(P)-binding protein [Hyphomonadaceae bacterium]|nr:NAD(P)-binding protein [Hyphomonadaceae bacterium]